jgi:Zn-dependent M28 family amino/carboxypeptidase
MPRRQYLSTVRPSFLALFVLCGCVPGPAPIAPAVPGASADVTGIISLARGLSADSMKGRGPWSRENEQAARFLADQLQRLGARPVFGTSLLVPFVSAKRPRDTVYNVVGVLPSKSASIDGRLIGITAHLDHLGVGPADSTGDTIYNGFLDDAIGIAMAHDIAKRYVAQPGTRPLVVMYFNLEEQGLLGSEALAARPDAPEFMARLDLLVGIDAGSPAGEALDWQLMGGLPEHRGTRLADSLATARGWFTVASPPRAISDVYPFAQKGVPILFPIPGQRWRDYMPQDRAAAMRRFDHYHSPQDEYDPAFPLVGTAKFADWVWDIIRVATAWP